MKKLLLCFMFLFGFLLQIEASTLSQFIGGKPKSEAFTSSGTWTRPSGVEWVEVLLVAGGGGGGGNDSGAAFSGGGGGGGQLIVDRKLRVTGNITVTIGAGGTGGASGVDGNDGSDTTLTSGAVLTAYGGNKGSLASGSDGNGGNGGRQLETASVNSGYLYSTQANVAGFMSLGIDTYLGGKGGKSGNNIGTTSGASSLFGFGRGGTSVATAGGGGGASYGDGADGVATAAGNAGAANTGGGGAGGGDGATGYAGGDGGSGYCVVYWIE